MKLTVTTEQGDVCIVDLPDDIELENVKALVASELPVLSNSNGDFELLWNTQPLSDKKKTLKAYGITDGEMLLAVPKTQPTASTRRPPASQIHRSPPSAAAGGGALSQIDFASIRVPGASRSPVRPQPAAAPASAPLDWWDDNSTNSEAVRQLLLSSREQLAVLRYRNPALAEAVNDAARFQEVLSTQRRQVEERARLEVADPFDVDAQRRIAESIQQSNIDHSMETAMEYMPESFGQVVMLYIACEVNGQAVKAFVDSGAQMTIMSAACARRCNIERLIDRRWAGIARGVGTQKIVGRVHLGQLKISGTFLPSSFTILEDQEMDLLIGLDMLRRHQCVIDLRRNCLVIGSNSTETPFLAEADLPAYARLSAQDGPTSPGGPGSRLPTGPGLSEEKIKALMDQGFSRNDARAELAACGGDVDSALAKLLSRRDLG